MSGKHAGGRRAEILDATLRVIGSSGAGAVTHRAVAAEAGASLSSTTYYFDSKEALIQEAFELVAERSTALVERVLGRAPPTTRSQLVERLVELSLAQLQGADAPIATQYELLLEAARRPELQPPASRWAEAYRSGVRESVAAAGVPGADAVAGVLIAALEGALLAELSTPGAGAEARLRDLLEALVEPVGARTATFPFTGLAPILMVADLAAERDFYESLGFPLTYAGPEVPDFYAFGHPPASFGIQLAAAPNDPGSVLTWQITVADVDVAVARCRAAAIPHSLERHDPAPGWSYRRLLLTTPSGFRLALEGPRE